MTVTEAGGRRHRAELVRHARGVDGTPLVNGIDWVEVGAERTTLLVHFLHPLLSPLTLQHVRLEGGVRVTGIEILAVAPSGESAVKISLDRAGDSSPYLLRLVGVEGFDDRLAEIEVHFTVDCPSEFDCAPTDPAPEPEPPSPPIDYLTKDYAGFRRLMLDRLATLLPGWTERNPADLWVTLVEALAYAADDVSYYQDAVATEAYLGTARHRISVRRHARLVDYPMHDGTNARAWLCFEVSRDLPGAALPAGTPVLSRSARGGVLVAPGDFQAALGESPAVFQTMHPIGELRVARNEILFHGWGDPGHRLARGATGATLVGTAADLALAEGDVLIIEQLTPPDPQRRHAVRLDRPPVPRFDAVTAVEVLDVRWHEADALPFDVSAQAAVARGNVVLADHGRPVTQPLTPAAAAARWRPVLERTGLTHAKAYQHSLALTEPAAAATTAEPREAMPVIELSGVDGVWRPRRDLIGSDGRASEFVVEMDDGGRAHLRFGDGVFGRRPSGEPFIATYRIGGGPEGNVGAEALGRVVTDREGITAVRNPLPATGGLAPETSDRVRFRASREFRSQQRAVTEADYVAAAQRHPQVQRAAATRRWTGSWPTMFVTVDRRHGRPVDAAFEAELAEFLEPYRLAGCDLEIEPPRVVPLDIALAIVVAPGHLRADVKRALLHEFAALFHPDNLTLGQPVYLSRLVAAAMAVPGVSIVDIDERAGTRFRRWGEPDRGELAAGRITMARLEVARLDNDPRSPEHGRLDFLMRGGI